MILMHYLVKCEDGMWLAEPGIPVEGFVFFHKQVRQKYISNEEKKYSQEVGGSRRFHLNASDGSARL